MEDWLDDRNAILILREGDIHRYTEWLEWFNANRADDDDNITWSHTLNGTRVANTYAHVKNPRTRLLFKLTWGV